MTTVFFMHYNWSVSEPGGFIVPHWSRTPGGQPHLEDVDLYSPDKEYRGSWARYNMPLDLVRHIEKRIKERVPREITDRGIRADNGERMF
jgi:hypothetical protein